VLCCAVLCGSSDQPLRAFGIEAYEISPEEAKQRWPLLSTEGLTGALWIPHDGVVRLLFG